MLLVARRPPAPRRGRAAARARRARSTCPCARRPTTTRGPGRGRARRRSTKRPASARNVVIVDTAGRLQVDTELMDELRAGARRGAAQRHAARRRRDDRSGGGERRDRVRRGGRARRRGAHQDRRRRPRRRRAVGEGGRRQADPLRRYRREARGLRAVPPRPDGEPHPRHGRRAHADREGRGHLRRRSDGRAGRGEAPQGAVHARGLPRPDAPGQEDGPDPEHHRR